MDPLDLLRDVTLGANIFLLCWFIQLIRRLRRLNALLDRICVRAWTLRHAPIWVPWSAMRGIEIEVNVVPRRSQASSPD